MSSSSHSYPFQSAQPRQDPLVEDEISSPLAASESFNREPTAASISSSTNSSHSTHSPDAHPEAPSPTQALHPVSSPENSTSSPASDQAYRGVPASTYLSRIAPERDIADSLDLLTARDLSIHLFNAFALKRRARLQISSSTFTSRRRASKGVVRTGRGKDAEVHEATTDDSDDASDGSITYEQVGDPGWHPPKAWTAWPVRAEEVPREEREWEEDGPFAALRDGEEESSNGTLAEILLGHVLKAAKERLRAKRLVDKDQHASSITKEGEGRSPSASSDGNLEEDVSTGDDAPFLAAEILADDDHAASILQPSIQHILSNLDKLLSNLHLARASYATPRASRNTRGFDGATSELPESNADISAASSNRKRRRSRIASSKHLQTQDQDVEDSTSSDENTSKNPRARKRQRTGSPNRSGSRHNSHSINKTASRPSSTSHPAPKSRSPPPPIANFGSHRSRYAPLDWSTVLGIASLNAFPPCVVERCAKRCANLFDEGMKFRVLKFDSANKGEDVDILPDAQSHARKDDSSKDSNADNSKLKRHRSSAQVPALGNIQVNGRDATHGGVHVDGFLQPIQRQKWWRKKPKKRKPKLLPEQARKGRLR